MNEILFYVTTEEDFTAEGRFFLKGNQYPVYDNKGASLLCAENGEFNFSNALMTKVIDEWDLTVVSV